MSIGVRKGPQWMNCCCSQEGNVYEVNNLYETSFPKLTDQFFKVRSDKNTPGKCGNWYIWHFTSRKTQGKIIQFSSKLFSQGVTMARSRGRGPLCQWWPHLPQPLQVPYHLAGRAISSSRIRVYNEIYIYTAGSSTSVTSTLESRFAPCSTY